MIRLWSFLCVMSMACGASQVRSAVQDRRGFVEHVEPGVLVVALGEDHADNPAYFGLRDVQFKIISAAARNGAVLVLASTTAQRARLEETCARYDKLCDRLYDETVRVVVEPHRGAWVRDFGPYFNIDRHGTVFVIDAKYDDARRDRISEYHREKINELRHALLEKQMNAQDTDTDEDRARTEELLRYSAELAQLYKDEGELRERGMDDDAPFYVAEAGLGNDHFEMVHTPISLEGGNLFVLEDGTCLTSTETVAKNGGDRGLVERELVTSYRCARVVFLDALAGEGVIKHVDMFLMPVKGKTLLLASYDPTSLHFRDRFASLDPGLRQLVEDSAVAMNRDKLHLKQLGYNVVDVPALFPRRAGDAVYFPTLLNGIVQVGRDRRRHLLMPDYDTTDKDEVAVKQAAEAVVRKTFEPGVDIQMIESTAPAQLQGALHCLTNMIPWSPSVFAKDDGLAKAVRDRISTFTASSSAPDSCLTPMLGEWHQVRVATDGSRSSYGPGGYTLVIEPTGMRMKTDGREVTRKHTVTCNPLRRSDATLKFEHDSILSMVTLRHNDDDTIAFLIDGGTPWTFVRQPALLKITQREEAAARVKRADDALLQASLDEVQARTAAGDDDFEEAAALYRRCSSGLDQAVSFDPAVSRRSGPGGKTYAELVASCRAGSAEMLDKLSELDQDAVDTEQGKAALEGFALASKAIAAKRMPVLELTTALRAAEACRANTGHLIELRSHDDRPVYDGKTTRLGELTLEAMHDRCTRMLTMLEARPAFGCGHHPVSVSQERASIEGRWGPPAATGKQTFEAIDCSEMPRRSLFPGASAPLKPFYFHACGKDAIYIIQQDRWLEQPTQRRMSGECWKKGYLTFHP